MLVVLWLGDFVLKLLVLKGVGDDLVRIVLCVVELVVMCGICFISRTHFDGGDCLVQILDDGCFVKLCDWWGDVEVKVDEAVVALYDFGAVMLIDRTKTGEGASAGAD